MVTVFQVFLQFFGYYSELVEKAMLGKNTNQSMCII